MCRTSGRLVTFTDPERARVGLSEADLIEHEGISEHSPAIEIVDKMTDRQITAKVREGF